MVEIRCKNIGHTNRELFAQKMLKMQEKYAKSVSARSVRSSNRY